MAYAEGFVVWSNWAIKVLHPVLQDLSLAGRRMVIDKAFAIPTQQANQAMAQAKKWETEAPGITINPDTSKMIKNLRDLQLKLNEAIIGLTSTSSFDRPQATS
jgi:hypothetical protein